MPRKRGQHKAQVVRLSLHPKICEYLERLIATGLYGNSVPEAATQLIRAGLESRLDVKVLLTKIADEKETSG